MACHGSQFTPELLQKMAPEFARVWAGKIPFIPATASMRGNDLFR
jgi:hypothetical protein